VTGWGLLAGVVAALTLALAPPAESAEPPGWWPAHVEFMTRGSGAWETPNPAAASDPEAPQAYGMQWERVNDGAGLTGRLYGVRNGEETGEFWTFREFYHPGRGVVVIEQWGGPGVYGFGETTAPGPDRGETDQTFWLPDGRSWREGHRTVEDGDLYHTDVFDIDADGNWTQRDRNVWRRVTRQVAPPS
jgi:hypothetical protein